MSVAAPGEVPGWEQISGLRARLSPQARIHRHRYRGQIWHVVHDRAAARFYRFGPGVFAFVAGLDGRATLEEVRISLETQLHDQAPEPQELVQLVAQLRGADLLVFDRPADAAALYERWDLERRSQWRSRLLRPLALRFPLVDPQPLLDLGARFVRPVFTLPGLMVWAAVVLAGGVLALSQGAALTEHAASRMLDPKNLLLLWLAYPVIKALHELGHGFAVKSWGGEVHEMGVMLLVLMPVPYVDASAASAFVNKRHRMAVGAAGILVETFIAAVALFVWSEAEPGTVRDLAFNVALIGGVSTLLFNGNPLLRFDGYYVLSDAIEIPNLAQRATRYYAYLAKHYLLGLADAASPVSAPGERPWFAFYAPAALIYRLGILVIIALYIADKLLALGVLLAVWAIAAQVLLPIGRQVHYVLSSPELIGRRRRALAITLVTAVALGATLHLAPATGLDACRRLRAPAGSVRWSGPTLKAS